MIALGIILGVLLIIALIHVGVRGEYSADGYFLDAFAGPVTVRIMPQEEKEEKPQKAKKAKEKAPEEEKKKKSGADVGTLMELISAGVEALGGFCRHLRIRKLKIHYTAAAEDPFSAAMQFGGASAGAGYLTAVMRQNFRVKKLELYTDVDFSAKKPVVYAAFHAGIPVWAVCSIGIRFLIRFLRTRKKPETTADTQGKAETEHG